MDQTKWYWVNEKAGEMARKRNEYSGSCVDEIAVSEMARGRDVYR